MKTAEEIVLHIEAELEEIRKQYKYWKDIDPSEAAKYLTKANTLESILEEIDPPEEEIAEVLVTDPRNEKHKVTLLEKHKVTLLEIYLNIVFLVAFLSSAAVVWVSVYKITKLLGIIGFLQEVFCYTSFCIHIFSFFQMFQHPHLLFTKGRA